MNPIPSMLQFPLARRGVSVLLASVLLLSSDFAVAQPTPMPSTQPDSTNLSAAEVKAQVNRPLSELVPSRPDGLTADEVARRAIANSPEMDLQAAQLREAAARVDETLAQFLPQLTAKASYTRLSRVNYDFGGGDEGGSLVGALNEGPLQVGPCPGGAGQCVLDSGGTPVAAAPLSFDIEDPPLNQYSLQASLSVPISDYFWTFRPAKIAALAEKQSAELKSRLERRTVEGNARTAYYNWLRALAQVEVTKISLQQIEARLRDAGVAFDAGAISAVEVRRLEAMQARTQAGLEAASGFRSLAAQQLAVMMGSQDAPTIPASSAWDEPVLQSERLDAKTQIEEARHNRLEYQSIEVGISGLKQGQKAARSRYYPRIDAFADFTYANPNQRFFPMEPIWKASWYAGVGLTWMIHQIPLARAQIRGLAAQESQLRAQRATLERGIELEVRKAVLDIQTADRTLAALRTSTAASAEAYRVATELFAAGESTASDLIDAQAELTSAQLQEINAAIDLKVARLRLELATGRELLDTKARGVASTTMGPQPQ